MIVLDTDYFSLLLRKDSTEGEEINRRLDLVEDDIATTIMTAEEQMRGWLAAIRRIRYARKQIPGYASLQRMFEFLADWNVLP